jgi:hypothetical protein
VGRLPRHRLLRARHILILGLRHSCRVPIPSSSYFRPSVQALLVVFGYIPGIQVHHEELESSVGFSVLFTGVQQGFGQATFRSAFQILNHDAARGAHTCTDRLVPPPCIANRLSSIQPTQCRPNDAALVPVAPQQPSALTPINSDHLVANRLLGAPYTIARTVTSFYYILPLSPTFLIIILGTTQPVKELSPFQLPTYPPPHRIAAPPAPPVGLSEAPPPIPHLHIRSYRARCSTGATRRSRVHSHTRFNLLPVALEHPL